MILQRLFELASRPGESILDEVAFEELPVPFVVKVGEGGKYLGIEERRGTETVPSRKKGAPPKIRQDKGIPLPVPRPHGNTASQGFARFFADTLARVLPLNDDEKSARSRKTFWEQLDRVAEETDDPALRAVQEFGRNLRENGQVKARVQSELADLKAGGSDRCTFAWDPDGGLTILQREPVRAWYRQFFQAFTGEKQQAGPQGVCQITGEFGPMPTSHPIRLGGVPGGLPTGVSLVSYDKAAFESYGLVGTANAGIGYRGADGYLRALTALIQHKLKGNSRTSLKVGNTLFLFWTREPANTDFMGLFEDPEQVRHLIDSVNRGQEDRGLEDPNLFFLLCLSGNSARAIVRDYLELPLGRIKGNLSQWFKELSIAGLSKEDQGKPTCRFPLWQLALATAADSDRVAPDFPARLMHAALGNTPLPDSVLANCLGRLRAEGSEGFRPARLALIKLTLWRRKIHMTETLNPDEKNPAYVCGRLLAVFEQIQSAALGEVNASVVDKYFGTFSAAPALVIGRLYNNAMNHLRKIRGEKPGLFTNLDKLLTQVSAALKDPPGGQLSLEDQGRFALGYYHQKARRFEEAAEKKAAKAQQASLA